jgi:beta-glucosidase
MNDLRFPAGFLWGTATAPHQVEGNNDNSDWWDWEQQPGHVRDGARSGLACDQWRRYEEDFDLAAAMHNNTHRLGVEWARVEPREGEWSGEALSHYRLVLQALQRRGITPMVTLHHFVNPRWLAAKGGWQNPEAVGLFERYAAKVVQELGDLIPLWCTVNEPMVHAYNGFVLGVWPPDKHSIRSAAVVLLHLLQGHAAAYRAIHAGQASAVVGLAHSLRIFDPANPASPLDRWAAGVRNAVMNVPVWDALVNGRIRYPFGLGAYLPEVAGTFDYFGVNYYHRDRVAFDLREAGQLFGRNLPPPDWEEGMPFFRGDVYPEGLYRLVMDLAPHGKPIYITENGLLDNDDRKRPGYIIEHLGEVHRAIQDGALVKGYYHWSLLDNFEWAEGYAARFGLVHTDFATQKRTMKRSGSLYGAIATANAITDEIVRRWAPEALSRVSVGAGQ